MRGLPRLNVIPQQPIMTNAFYGINRNLLVSDGELNDEMNLISSNFPQLSCRAGRMKSALLGHGEQQYPSNPYLLLGDGKDIYAYMV